MSASRGPSGAATITFAANRRLYAQWTTSVPSRFVEELPREHVEHLFRNPAMRPDIDPFVDDNLFGPKPSRFRSRRAELGKLVEGKAEILTTRPIGQSRLFTVGERVFHDKFGYGRVARRSTATSSTSPSRRAAARR